MQNFIYHMPVKVYFEEGGVKKYLSKEMEKYGKNIMIVYGGGSVKRNGILDEVRKTLEECGKTVFEFGGVASSPSYEKILEGIAMYKKESIDLMIALGGGSVVDSTKIMAAGAEIEGDIWDEEMIRHNIPEKMGKYAVVLTISGAGAEMDHLGACTNEKTHEKKTFVGPYADFVIEDPAYVMSVPLHTFTPGVFDSLSHCMETCFGQGTNVWYSVPLSKASQSNLSIATEALLLRFLVVSTIAGVSSTKASIDSSLRTGATTGSSASIICFSLLIV